MLFFLENIVISAEDGGVIRCLRHGHINLVTLFFVTMPIPNLYVFFCLRISPDLKKNHNQRFILSRMYARSHLQFESWATILS